MWPAFLERYARVYDPVANAEAEAEAEKAEAKRKREARLCPPGRKPNPAPRNC